MGKKHRQKKDNVGRRCATQVEGASAPVPARRQKSSRRALAVHEAGHGVARMHLFGDVDRLAINDKGAGIAKYTKPSVVGIENPSRAQLEAAMLVALAGYAAELRLAPDQPGVGDGLDYDLAKVQAITHMGGFSEAEVSYVAYATAAFVAAHTVEIRAVADELNGCGMLRGRKVAEIAQAARAVAQAA